MQLDSEEASYIDIYRADGTLVSKRTRRIVRRRGSLLISTCFEIIVKHSPRRMLFFVLELNSFVGDPDDSIAPKCFLAKHLSDAFRHHFQHKLEQSRYQSYYLHKPLSSSFMLTSWVMILSSSLTFTRFCSIESR